MLEFLCGSFGHSQGTVFRSYLETILISNDYLLHSFTGSFKLVFNFDVPIFCSS